MQMRSTSGYSAENRKTGEGDRTSVQTTDGISIRLLTDPGVLPSVAEEWDELVSDSSATIYQTFDWQYLWWKHFAPPTGCTLSVVLFRNGKRLVGIAPFFLQTYKLMHAPIFRQLKLIGSGLQSERTAVISLEREGPGDYLDIIARRGYEETVGQGTADFIKTNRGDWDEIEFQNLPEDGLVTRYVLPLLSDPALKVAAEPSDVCPQISLPATIDDFLSAVNQRTRRSLRRSQKAYLENAGFTLDRSDSCENAGAALDELAALHQRHWNSSGYPGLFSDKRFTSMQKDLVEAFSRTKRLWLDVLRHDGKPIAARLCFTLSGRVYDYLSGVERKSNQTGAAGYSGAGIALMMLAVGRAIDSHHTTFDLLRGDENYKKAFATYSPNNIRAKIQKVKKPNGIRYTAYRLTSAGFSISLRLTCEIAIFRLIAKDAGYLRAPSGYAAHLKRRLTRPDHVTAETPPSSRNHDKAASSIAGSPQQDMKAEAERPGAGTDGPRQRDKSPANTQTGPSIDSND